MQLMAIAGAGGLAMGLIFPRLGVALGITLFIVVLATFVIASRAGTPVPHPGWLLGIAAGMLAATVGWLVRGRRRA